MTNLIKTKLAGGMIVALCVAALAPSWALAQQIDPTTSQYGDQLTQIETGKNDSTATVTVDAEGPTGLSGKVGPLPFTGFDVIAMAAVALAVAGLGLELQRAVSRAPNDGVS